MIRFTQLNTLHRGMPRGTSGHSGGMFGESLRQCLGCKVMMCAAVLALLPASLALGNDQAPLRFTVDVVPVLTKLGCNSGGCHGKATGQNGFKLSLLGFEPGLDYRAIVKEGRGRRVSPAAPARSLLLKKATNETPHERMFSYRRRTASGQSIPSWLCEPGPILLKRHVRSTKYEPSVEPVELIEANPHYAHVRLPNGREDTVSIRDLAPMGSAVEDVDLQNEVESGESVADPAVECRNRTASSPEPAVVANDAALGAGEPLRRAVRKCKPVDRLNL